MVSQKFSKKRFKNIFLLFQFILLVSPNPVQQDSAVTIISLKIDLNEFLSKLLELKEQVDERINILTNGLDVSCADYSVSIPSLA